MNHSQQLRENGLKATGPRIKILKLFENTARRHLTAEEVYRELLKDDIDIGLATVYRVLTQFEQAGLLARHHFDSGRAVYELNEGEHHDHLVCMQCGKVIEFLEPVIEDLQEKVASEHGFRIQEHALYLYAECTKANCENRPANAHSNLKAKP